MLAGISSLVLSMQISTPAELCLVCSALQEALEETWQSAWKIFEDVSEEPLEFTVTKWEIWDLLCSQGDDFCLFIDTTSLEEKGCMFMDNQGLHK